MKLALVVPRYGPGVGGPEADLCRAVLRAARGWAEGEAEVLTTCALSEETWEDHFPAGAGREDGVLVRRFPVDFPRSLFYFHRVARIVFEPDLRSRLTPELEKRFLREQGPWSSELFRHLAAEPERVWLFCGAAYAPVCLGLPRVRGARILAPVFDDEPRLRFAAVRSVLAQADGFLYRNETERRLIDSVAAPTAPGAVRPAEDPALAATLADLLSAVAGDGASAR